MPTSSTHSSSSSDDSDDGGNGSMMQKSAKRKKKEHKVFDPETGALSREYDSFRPKKEPRGFGRTLKLDKHPLMRPGISVVIGPTGTGKTTLQLNELEEILTHADPDRLDRVMMYSGSPQDELLQKLDPEVIDLYGPDTVEKFLGELRDMMMEISGSCGGEDGEKESTRPMNILILDDVGNDRTLTPPNTKGTEIGDIYMRHRHLKLHISISGQRWKMLPPFVRSNFSHLFVFPGKSKKELQEMFSEIPLAQEPLLRAMSALQNKPHSFLWIDMINKCAKVGFDKVILS